MAERAKKFRTIWNGCVASSQVFQMLRYFSVLNSEIQVSFFRKLPLQNLVFLKFYSLNEEAVRTKIRR